MDVTINPATRDAFFKDFFIRFPELEQAIIDDFTRYKETGELPSYFGRDVAYTQPYAAFKSGLMHIHLALPPKSFSVNLPQADRVCRKGVPDDDACLVYVQGLMEENTYSLIAVMHPDAHGEARRPEIMNYLCRIAQDFKDNN